jgi:uncharacterized repeat protein (TIGR01451 family)
VITRVFQRKQPRRAAPAVVAAGVIIAATLLATGALAALVTDSGTVDIMATDNTGAPSFTFSSGAFVQYIGDASNKASSGTGLFDPFVRIQGSAKTAPTEKGYNTNAAVEFDAKSGSWTKAIKASAIPIVDCDGSGPGTATCWELFNDINEGNSAKYISLTKVEVWFTDSATLTGYPFPVPGTTNNSLEYQFTGEIKMHDVNSGSGRGDLTYLIPTAGHPFTSSTYFVLYSEWGSLDAAPDGKNFATEGGFEEWKVRKAPNVSIIKTANPVGPVNAGTTIGFDITVSNTGAAAASNVTISDPLPPGGEWTLSPSFTGCAITGSFGSQVLNCSFSSLAAGGTIGPIHIASPTTAADCGVVNNLATVSVGGTAVDDDDASVTIQCGALKITKTAKHADTSGNTSANLVATFTIVDALGVSRTLTTDSTGLGCIGGLAVGNTQSITESSVPSGYSAPTIANVNVASGSCSGTTLTGGTGITVTNTPLTTIGWSVDSQRNGATNTTVTCRDSAGNVISGYPITVSDGTGSLPNLPPTAPGATVTCAFVVDP